MGSNWFNRTSKSCVRGMAKPASSIRALRYFSAHCWAWKQTPLQRGRLRRRDRSTAARKSSSALATHSRVLGFIHDLASGHHLGDEGVAPAQTTFDLFRRAHQEVHRKPGGDAAANLQGRASAPPSDRHDHHEVHIRVRGGRPVGVRAEEDDALRTKLPRDRVAVALDVSPSDHGGRIGLATGACRDWDAGWPEPKVDGLGQPCQALPWMRVFKLCRASSANAGEALWKQVSATAGNPAQGRVRAGKALATRHTL